MLGKGRCRALPGICHDNNMSKTDISVAFWLWMHNNEVMWVVRCEIRHKRCVRKDWGPWQKVNHGGDWLTMQHHARNVRISWDIRGIMQVGARRDEKKGQRSHMTYSFLYTAPWFRIKKTLNAGNCLHAHHVHISTSQYVSSHSHEDESKRCMNAAAVPMRLMWRPITNAIAMSMDVGDKAVVAIGQTSPP